MQDLEWHDLGDGSVIVDVTNLGTISEVTAQMSQRFTWEHLELKWVQEDDDEEPTEWAILTGAQPAAKKVAL